MAENASFQSEPKRVLTPQKETSTHIFKMDIFSNFFEAFMRHMGPSINYVVSRGEGGGQKLPILLSKKTTKRGGGGQKLSILRRHSLWTAPIRF